MLASTFFLKEMPADSASIITMLPKYYFFVYINCGSNNPTLCTKIIIPTLLWFSMALSTNIQQGRNSLPCLIHLIRRFFSNNIH